MLPTSIIKRHPKTYLLLNIHQTRWIRCQYLSLLLVSKWVCAQSTLGKMWLNKQIIELPKVNCTLLSRSLSSKGFQLIEVLLVNSSGNLFMKSLISQPYVVPIKAGTLEVLGRGSIYNINPLSFHYIRQHLCRLV